MKTIEIGKINSQTERTIGAVMLMIKPLVNMNLKKSNTTLQGIELSERGLEISVIQDGEQMQYVASKEQVNEILQKVIGKVK